MSGDGKNETEMKYPKGSGVTEGKTQAYVTACDDPTRKRPMTHIVTQLILEIIDDTSMRHARGRSRVEMADMSTHEHTQSASITCMYGWTLWRHVVAYLKVKIGLPRVVPLLCEGPTLRKPGHHVYTLVLVWARHAHGRRWPERARKD